MKTPAVLILLPISAIFHVSVFATSDSSIAQATVYSANNLQGDVWNIDTDRCWSTHTRTWIRSVRSVDVPPGGCVRLCGSHSGTENCRFFRHGTPNKNLPQHVSINSICPCNLQSMRKRTVVITDFEDDQLPDSPEYPY